MEQLSKNDKRKIGFVIMIFVLGIIWILSNLNKEPVYKGVLLIGPNMERTYYPDAVALMENGQNENQIGLKDKSGRIYQKLDKRNYKGYVEVGGEHEFDDWIGTKVIFEDECVDGVDGKEEHEKHLKDAQEFLKKYKKQNP